MDQTDFANSLATLNLSAVMCRGFEEEAFGAIQGLFRFRALTDGGRHAWDKAVTRAMADRIPTGQRTSRAFFYSMLGRSSIQCCSNSASSPTAPVRI
jgi:hypothetical protein